MRILIATSFFPPTKGIASERPYSWAQRWTDAGHDVTVITPGEESNVPSPIKVITTPGSFILKHFKHTNETLGLAEKNTDTSGWLKQGLDWFRQSTGVMSGCRMPDATDLWVGRAIKALRSQAPWDIVISTAPPLAIHRLGYQVKQAQLAKHWVMDYRDLIIGHPATDGLFPFNVFERWLENRYVRSTDAITTVNHGLEQNMRKRFSEAAIHVVENGYNHADVMDLPNDHAFKRDKKFRIVHMGSFFPGKQNPEPLFQAIKELSQSATQVDLMSQLEVRFYGHRLIEISHLIKQHNVGEWVQVYGTVSYAEALHIQRDAHALLFLPWTDPYLEGVVPSKLFEHLASGTEIIAVGATHLEASQRLMMEAQTGEVLLDNLQKIKHYLVQRLEWAPKKPKAYINHQLLERYSQASLADKMLKILTKVTQRAVVESVSK